MKAKTHLSQAKSRGGFTLVEMLVVIGMIAALAGISFPVYRGIQKKVERQQFEMTMAGFHNAVDNFETEYNYLPTVGGPLLFNNDEWVIGNNVSALYSMLAGIGDTANFKKIKFFECQDATPTSEGEGFKNGIHENNDGSISYYTPWARQLFVMQIDTNMNGEMRYQYGIGLKTSNRKIIYWDPGPDNVWENVDDFTNFDEYLSFKN